ncbi:hypothetical protein Tco_0630260 [Tanacetum coccineum]
MGLPSTLDEGTRKSQPLPEDTTTHPKYTRGNIQPLDRDLTSMTSDEGTAKTTLHPKGPLGDKDSRGNILPADMKPVHLTVANLSGTDAKYQLQTLADVQAFLLSEEEMDNESDEEEVLAAREDIDEDP